MRRHLPLLLAGVTGLAVGVFFVSAQIGWYVFAANAVRDTAIMGMQTQGEALAECRGTAVKPTNRKPRSYRL